MENPRLKKQFLISPSVNNYQITNIRPYMPIVVFYSYEKSYSSKKTSRIVLQFGFALKLFSEDFLRGFLRSSTNKLYIVYYTYII